MDKTLAIVHVVTTLAGFVGTIGFLAVINFKISLMWADYKVRHQINGSAEPKK